MDQREKARSFGLVPLLVAPPATNPSRLVSNEKWG